MQRAPLVESALEVFRVDTGGLTKEQKYQLALRQIHARERRFRTVARVVVLLALLLAGVSAYAIARTMPAAAAPPPGGARESPRP
jgi:hypothetical protein